MRRYDVLSRRVGMILLLPALVLQGCGLFVSSYDATAYQNFTNLKAFHVKFLEDNKVAATRVFDKAKASATCEAGELKFREATEYAAGRKDASRVRAITYLNNVFSRDCKMATKALLGATFADEEIIEATKQYDWAIQGELGRVGADSNK